MMDDIIDRMVKWLYPHTEWKLLMPWDMEEIFGTDCWEVCYRASDLLNRATMATWPSQEQIIFNFMLVYLALPMMVITELFMIWVIFGGG